MNRETVVVTRVRISKDRCFRFHVEYADFFAVGRKYTYILGQQQRRNYSKPMSIVGVKKQAKAEELII